MVSGQPAQATHMVRALRRCDHPSWRRHLTGVGKQEAAFLRRSCKTAWLRPGASTVNGCSCVDEIIIRTEEAREADWVIASAGGAGEFPAWVRRALANGVESALLSSAGRGLTSPASRVSPERLEPMVGSEDRQVSTLTMRLVSRLEEHRKQEASSGETTLTPAQEDLVAAGKLGYLVCAACHQADGQGLEGRAPPLVRSGYVLGPKELLIRIALFGKEGTAGYPAMPPIGMGDSQMAGILSYIRRAWVTNPLPCRLRRWVRTQGGSDAD